ncbi:MAG: hypothetical protein ABSA13_16500 [Beijerinckiaceae bacterium]|jgi:hypothetical protein
MYSVTPPRANLFSGKHTRRLKFGLIAAVLACVGVDIARVGYLAYLDYGDPRTALRLRPSDPSATLKLADERMQEQRLAQIRAKLGVATAPAENANPLSSQEIEQMRQDVEAALAREPLDAGGVRLLGELRNDSSSKPLMLAALDLSKHENRALGWLIADSLKNGSYKESLDYLDILLRSDPVFIQPMALVLVAMLENAAIRPDVTRLLTTNPPWSRQMLPILLQRIGNPDAAVSLLSTLKEQHADNVDELVNVYSRRLLGEKNFETAFSAWRRLLAPDQSAKLKNIYNGDFSLARSGSPFDWTFSNVNGVSIGIVETNESSPARALRLEYGVGRAAAHSVSEIVKLAPGRFKFGGSYKGALIGPRGHIWRLVCVNGAGNIIGQSELIFGAGEQWRDFSFDVDVPDHDCPFQRVELFLDARSASESLVSGQILYRNLWLAP